MTRATFLPPGSGEHLDVLGSPMELLLTAADTGGQYEVVLVDAAGDGDPLPHRHPWEEFYLVLDGTLDVQIGKRQHVARAGALVTIPAGALHAFTVLSRQARFLHVSIGRGATAAFRDYHLSVPGVPTPEDIPMLLEINRRHGVEVLVPGIGIVRGPEDLERLGAMDPQGATDPALVGDVA